LLKPVLTYLSFFRLIYNVTSSSDLLNYYIQLKDDVIASMSNATVK